MFTTDLEAFWWNASHNLALIIIVLDASKPS